MSELIDDPVKGIAYCNKNIEAIEVEMTDATPADRMKLRNQILGFTELLEKFIHQKRQQGYDQLDIAKGSETKKGKKARFDAD